MTEHVHMDVKVNCQPTEMGIRLDIHSRTFNLTLEFDPHEDPLWMQSVLVSAPEFIIHSLSKITADDSPFSAREWWEDGMERLGQVRAEHVEVDQ